MTGMVINHRVVVFDAADLAAESTFWAGVLGGAVDADDDWHMVFVDGEPRVGVQLPRTTSGPSGPMERPSRFTSTCGSMTSTRRMTKSWHWARSCSSPPKTGRLGPRTTTRSTRTRPGTRSVCAGCCPADA